MTHNSARQQYHQQSNKPQQLKLTDYLRPVFQEAALIREYCQFATIQQQIESVSQSSSSDDAKALTGLYVIPSAQSIYTWFGLISVSNIRGTSTASPWNGANFRFHIKFPESFPSATPVIYMAPICPSIQNPHHFKHMTTHADVNSTTGQFNFRGGGGIQGSYKIYKILRAFRKSFYKIDTSDGHDPEEYLKRCALEVEQSLKWVSEVDAYLIQRFKGDKNLMLLGGEGGASNGIINRSSTGAEVNGECSGVGHIERIRKKKPSHLGLSFL